MREARRSHSCKSEREMHIYTAAASTRGVVGWVFLPSGFSAKDTRSLQAALDAPLVAASFSSSASGWPSDMRGLSARERGAGRWREGEAASKTATHAVEILSQALSGALSRVSHTRTSRLLKSEPLFLHRPRVSRPSARRWVRRRPQGRLAVQCLYTAFTVACQ